MQRASFEIQQKSFIHSICIIFVTATSWHRLHTIWNWNNIVWIKNWYLWRTIRPSRTIKPRFRAFFISSADYIRVMQFRDLLALGINHSGLHNHFLLILLLLYNTRIHIISWPLDYDLSPLSLRILIACVYDKRQKWLEWISVLRAFVTALYWTLLRP